MDHKQSSVTSNISLEELYFRWLKNIVIELGKTASGTSRRVKMVLCNSLSCITILKIKVNLVEKLTNFL